MDKTRLGVGAMVAIGFASVSASAANAADVCTAKPVTVAVASAPDIANGAPISLGAMSAVSLWSADQITLAIPRGTATASSFGGSASLKVTVAGTFLFQSDTKVTIDVLRKGSATLIASSAAGLSCSGFVQAASYTLMSGDYVVQFAQNGSSTLRLLVTK